MKIAIIGAGNVGKALGNAWGARGHRVTFGVRDPNSPKLDAIDRTKFAIAMNADASRSADVIVLATPWGGTADAIAACGALNGKILLDATNPLLPALAGLDHAQAGGKSGGTRVAEWAAGAKVVKIFNTTGYNNMERPTYEGERSIMLYCGDDAVAKNVARGLADEIGFDPIDVGGLANAGHTESFAMMWIWIAVKSGQGREVAFKLMRR